KVRMTMPATVLYLIRHGATMANLEQPYRLQGRRTDDALSPLGIRQSERTRDYLTGQPPAYYYCSPLRRALQTAQIIAGPGAASVVVLDELTECDVGRWEGLSWDAIREQDTVACEQFLADPGVNGYPGGENYTQVADRVTPVVDLLLRKHIGETVLV